MENILAELSDQVRAANDKKRRLALRGGATRAFYGEDLAATDDNDWLELGAYQGVVDYEPSELVLVARAGTPLSEIEALVDGSGQMLAFEPPRFGARGTLGGCVASGMSGPRRMAVGPCSDFVLGARLMSANGQVLRFGGEVMKNVAGYDLPRLLTGSLGILGPIMEVSMKVLPKPRQEATVVLGLDEAAALRQCVAWRSKPMPVSATAWQPEASGSSGRLSVRLSGNASAVRQAKSQIGGSVLPDAEAAAFWQSLRDQTHTFFQDRPLWRVVLPPGVPPLPLTHQLHEWQGCLRWASGPQDAAALRAQVQALGGSVTLYRGDDSTRGQRVFHPLSQGLMNLHKRLKQQMDPAGIFNPGRMYPEF